MNRQIIYCFAMIMLFFTQTGRAGVVVDTVEYQHRGTSLQGILAYEDSAGETAPGILIVHQWTGVGKYEKMRAVQLAEKGYIVFALDMYGTGIRPKNNKEAGQQAGKYRNDRALMRQRAQAGLDFLKSQSGVHETHIAAVGYCFGGGVVLELARSGANVAGFVSFHGNLDTPDPKDAENIKGRVLVHHGGADPHVNQEQVQAFWTEMENAGVDWQMNVYGGAVHAFTDKYAGDDPSMGAAYDDDADRSSWKSTMRFFQELFDE